MTFAGRGNAPRTTRPALSVVGRHLEALPGRMAAGSNYAPSATSGASSARPRCVDFTASCQRRLLGARRRSTRRNLAHIKLSLIAIDELKLSCHVGQRGRWSYVTLRHDISLCEPYLHVSLVPSSCPNRLKLGESGEGGDGRDDLGPRRGSSIENAVFGVLFTLRCELCCLSASVTVVVRSNLLNDWSEVLVKGGKLLSWGR